MDVLYIVMPAYNEEETLPMVVEEWYPVIERHPGGGKSRLVIVNDGSKDRTEEIGQELMKKYPNFILLTKENGGHGDTVLYAYQYAIDAGADYIFQTDSDGQTNPDEFDQFWELRENHTAILGDRQASRQDGKSRVFVEDTLRLILKMIFGVSVPDANAPFRLMKAEVLQKYIRKLPAHYNLPNAMLTTYFAYFKEPVRFIGISFKPRQGGVNSINIKKIIRIGMQAVSDFRYLKAHIDD